MEESGFTVVNSILNEMKFEFLGHASKDTYICITFVTCKQTETLFNLPPGLLLYLETIK